MSITSPLRSVLGVSLAAILAAAPLPSSAEEAEPANGSAPTSSAGPPKATAVEPLVVYDPPRPAVLPAHNERQPTVKWNDAWARYRPLQYGTTAVLIAADIAIVMMVPDPDPRWDGALPFDGASRTVLRGGSGEARERAQLWSDRLHQANFLIGLTEAPLTAGIAHGNWDVALQLSLINAQSYAVAGFVQLLSARVVGRVRPFVEECKQAGQAGEGDEFPCKAGGTTLSFLSGHAMTSFVSAGLMCAHHGRLPLYGGGWGDVSACAAMLVSAATTGALRVVADKHYFSDVLFGSILGFAFGYGLPMWLHYGKWNNVTTTDDLKTKKKDTSVWHPMAPIPWVGTDRIGASFSAFF